MIDYKNPRFVKTAVLPEHYPKFQIPEIAVVGRSNVGKSSLLNHLFQKKNLVRTSATPGKTQAINFFSVEDKLCFVDLPGYGFAKVPIEVRKSWGPLIQTYLEERNNLKLLLFLFDIRRVPKDEDVQLLQWAKCYNKKVIIVLTKTDKVNQKEKRDNTKKILEVFEIEGEQVIHYSVKKNMGRKLLIKMIDGILEEV